MHLTENNYFNFALRITEFKDDEFKFEKLTASSRFPVEVIMAQLRVYLRQLEIEYARKHSN